MLIIKQILFLRAVTASIGLLYTVVRVMIHNAPSHERVSPVLARSAITNTKHPGKKSSRFFFGSPNLPRLSINCYVLTSISHGINSALINFVGFSAPFHCKLLYNIPYSTYEVLYSSISSSPCLYFLPLLAFPALACISCPCLHFLPLGGFSRNSLHSIPLLLQ